MASRRREEWCAILGVSPEADEHVLKMAYRKLALKYHPDKNPDNPEATKMFQEVSEAYRNLTQPAEAMTEEFDVEAFFFTVFEEVFRRRPPGQAPRAHHCPHCCSRYEVDDEDANEDEYSDEYSSDEEYSDEYEEEELDDFETILK
eukprot:Colp12_sorted_trinity150504_noHs@27369